MGLIELAITKDNVAYARADYTLTSLSVNSSRITKLDDYTSLDDGVAIENTAVYGDYIYLNEDFTDMIVIMDVSDPSDLQLAARFPVSFDMDYQNGFHVYDKYLVMVNDGTDSIYFFDLSNPLSPDLIKTASLPVGYYRSVLSGDYLYILGSDSKIYTYNLSFSNQLVTIDALGNLTNISFDDIAPEFSDNLGDHTATQSIDINGNLLVNGTSGNNYFYFNSQGSFEMRGSNPDLEFINPDFSSVLDMDVQLKTGVDFEDSNVDFNFYGDVDPIRTVFNLKADQTVTIGDGTDGDLIVSNDLSISNGDLTFADGTTQSTAATADNLGNHIVTQNIDMNDFLITDNTLGSGTGGFSATNAGNAQLFGTSLNMTFENPANERIFSLITSLNETNYDDIKVDFTFETYSTNAETVMSVKADQTVTIGDGTNGDLIVSDELSLTNGDIKLSGNYISNDGDDEGIQIADNGDLITSGYIKQGSSGNGGFTASGFGIAVLEGLNPTLVLEDSDSSGGYKAFTVAPALSDAQLSNTNTSFYLSDYTTGTDVTVLTLQGDNTAVIGDGTNGDLIVSDELSLTNGNIKLSGNYVSNDGDDEGLSIDDSGTVTASGDLIAPSVFTNLLESTNTSGTTDQSIVVNGANWINFRTGNTGGQEAGSIFSSYGTSHYFVANKSNDLRISYSTENSNSPSHAASTTIFEMDSSGNLNIDGTLTENSDRRLKKDFEPLTGALDRVAQIQAYYYCWIDADRRGDQRELGVIAQEVRAVAPELVSEDQEGILSVSYSKMSALILAAIKEQQLQLDQLKTENQSLQADVSNIKKHLGMTSSLNMASGK